MRKLLFFLIRRAEKAVSAELAEGKHRTEPCELEAPERCGMRSKSGLYHAFSQISRGAGKPRNGSGSQKKEDEEEGFLPSDSSEPVQIPGAPDFFQTSRHEKEKSLEEGVSHKVKESRLSTFGSSRGESRYHEPELAHGMARQKPFGIVLHEGLKHAVESHGDADPEEPWRGAVHQPQKPVDSHLHGVSRKEQTYLRGGPAMGGGKPEVESRKSRFESQGEEKEEIPLFRHRPQRSGMAWGGYQGGSQQKQRSSGELGKEIDCCGTPIPESHQKGQKAGGKLHPEYETEPGFRQSRHAGGGAEKQQKQGLQNARKGGKAVDQGSQGEVQGEPYHNLGKKVRGHAASLRESGDEDMVSHSFSRIFFMNISPLLVWESHLFQRGSSIVPLQKGFS